jgi:Ras-related protein Rab-2A
MSQPSWDYIAKIVSIGDSGTGKSSLTVRLCEGRFQRSHDVTIGVEFGSRIIPVGPPASLSLHINNPSSPTTASQPSSPTKKQKYMKLSLWDTAGQETYKSITRSYFRGASGALLVFDISRRATFDSATAWLNDLRLIAEDGIVVVLVGNKSDLAPASDETDTSQSQTPRKREVTRAEAEAWSKAHNVLTYIETSAKSGDNVELAFRQVAERIFQGIEAGRYNLEDRRSGVKRAGVGGQRGSVSMNSVLAGTSRGGAAGGCC